MSEKRSWDIAPRRAAGQAPAKRAPADVVLVGRVSARRSRESLRKRRRRGRRRGLLIATIILIIVLAGALYLAWQPYLRVQTVNAGEGPDATLDGNAAKTALAGTYFHVIPRDSIFFVPEAGIRAAVLSADPNVAAISVSRTSLTAISLDLIPRDTAYVWCGETYASSTGGMPCYDADANGVIFAAMESAPSASSAASGASAGLDQNASSTEAAPPQRQVAPNGELMVYAPLASSTPQTLGSAIADASALPGALRFARALDTLNADSVAIALRGDEADVYLASGTRVTYVIGQEQAAANAAAAAFPNLDLQDGSVQYIDLRFPGKAYVKKAGEAH